MFSLFRNFRATSKEIMKLQILSDLHTEFADFALPETDADVIVLAGDIGVGVGGLNWTLNQRLSKTFIYVPGNHEFYGHDISLIDELRNSAPRNLHVLDNEQVVIDDIRFLGAVLWTDFCLFGEAEKWFSMQRARQDMNDFFHIRYGDRRFTPADSVALHEVSRRWLTAKLAEPFGGKTIVVTHHAPSARSVAPRFVNDLLTPAFASNLEELMDGQRAVLWIHGHMHDPFDYEINGTRVVCNPRGYPGESASWPSRAPLVLDI
jgi:predicted phosphodiesterase